MKKVLVGAGVALVLTIIAQGANAQQEVAPDFKPAQIVSTVDPAYPFNVVVKGAVTVEIQLDEHGEIENIKVITDAKSLTEEVVKAVGKWKFTPATLGGKPVTSTLYLAVVFRTTPCLEF